MKRLTAKLLVLLTIAGLTFGNVAVAAESEEDNKTSFIMHHIKDAHEWHLAGEHESSITIPLPIILYNSGHGLAIFSSSEFHHDDEGKQGVTRGDLTFLKYHEKIYIANANGEIELDESDHPLNAKPTIDLSITKNVMTSLVTAIVLVIFFTSVASGYKKRGVAAPKGIQSILEPVIIFVRDEIARPNINAKKVDRFMPYLLSIFFFIWIANLLGLFPGAANLTGNIAITFTFAIITFLYTNFNGNRNYWSHIFVPPGVPWWLLWIMWPVEIMGLFTKPFSLMVRLFANITAGHIIILSIIGLIFIFGTWAVGFVSVPFAVAMTFLELLVAFIQAYVFTLLSAIYIGGAVEEAHDH